MPRLFRVPLAASLLALPLAGCDDAPDGADADDPEAAQVAEEQEDVNDVRGELKDAREDLADMDEEIAEERSDVKEAILEKEEQEDKIGDLERQLDKELADLEAEKTDREPDLAGDPDVAPILPDAPDPGPPADLPAPGAVDPAGDDPDVKVEADPGVDVEVETDGTL